MSFDCENIRLFHRIFFTFALLSFIFVDINDISFKQFFTHYMIFFFMHFYKKISQVIQYCFVISNDDHIFFYF